MQYELIEDGDALLTSCEQDEFYFFWVSVSMMLLVFSAAVLMIFWTLTPKSPSEVLESAPLTMDGSFRLNISCLITCCIVS
ncbi:hypothetical protein D7Y27_38610 [Corallococcus sp. AB004]|nr:hypothetical protein D7Y27_38610 [Corallococcus sp. AB004]